MPRFRERTQRAFSEVVPENLARETPDRSRLVGSETSVLPTCLNNLHSCSDVIAADYAGKSSVFGLA